MSNRRAKLIKIIRFWIFQTLTFVSELLLGLTEREGLSEAGWYLHWKEEIIGKEDQDGIH
jgi:hypothetical protein